MKPIAVIMTLLILAVAAHAAAPGDPGYRNCSLHNLGACQNSNQLFFGAAPKPEFSKALVSFLHGAPGLYLGKYSFAPAQVATNSLTGPGDHHDHLRDGNWFFDGFTPHNATDRGAVILNANGTIVVVALLNIEADMAGPNPTPQVLSQYRLRLYSHDEKPSAPDVGMLNDWARKMVGNQSLYPGVFPNNSLVATQLLVLEKDHWMRGAP